MKKSTTSLVTTAALAGLVLLASGCFLNRPWTPYVCSGPTSGCVDSVYTFTVETALAAEVRLAWGDGDTTKWLSVGSDTLIGCVRPMPPPMPEYARASHAWVEAGSYPVTAQAQSAYGISTWGGPWTITVIGSE